MKRADAVFNQICSLAINNHKAQTNVEVSCKAAYTLGQPLTIIMSTLHTLICDASDCKLATPSAARLLLYLYVQRNVNVQGNTTQYLERVWFDYCSVHVSTVISHVSQQFRFLVFFIVTQRVVSGQWNYFYELEYLSLMVVRVSLSGLKRCTNL
ncbi:nuclear transcription factor Y subunit B [Trichinella spiralis]|uniref:nuclear transcription factor Y subunit B n=1 Tax=Trichinella spiralis TaxID=6334 RepID=UPI0001EFB82E|nr:nuclear transcription factor Y subunit B [Trichinella spiralis]